MSLFLITLTTLISFHSVFFLSVPVEAAKYDSERAGWLADTKRWEQERQALRNQMEVMSRDCSKIVMEASDGRAAAKDEVARLRLEHDIVSGTENALMSRHFLLLAFTTCTLQSACPSLSLPRYPTSSPQAREERERGFDHERRTFDADRRQWLEERDELRSELKTLRASVKVTMKSVNAAESSVVSLNGAVARERRENDRLRAVVLRFRRSVYGGGEFDFNVAGDSGFYSNGMHGADYESEVYRTGGGFATHNAAGRVVNVTVSPRKKSAWKR
jgi:hypothetical protein